MSNRHKYSEYSKEYHAWYSMIDRCTNDTHKSWPRYGGRGITVCQRWTDSFDAFIDDVGACPHPRLSIDRLDNNGNYEPGNVAWRTSKEQMNNKTQREKPLTINGETLPLGKWAARAGIGYIALYYRMKAGDTGEHLIRPKRSSRAPNRRRG